jgi:hypothetical protein
VTLLCGSHWKQKPTRLHSDSFSVVTYNFHNYFTLCCCSLLLFRFLKHALSLNTRTLFAATKLRKSAELYDDTFMLAKTFWNLLAGSQSSLVLGSFWNQPWGGGSKAAVFLERAVCMYVPLPSCLCNSIFCSSCQMYHSIAGEVVPMLN